jgi:hypothetical protein
VRGQIGYAFGWTGCLISLSSLLRSTQRQVQSLHWVIDEAARKRITLYVAYLDFENAFNSIDHEALFRWLEELQIPDLDLIHAL